MSLSSAAVSQVTQAVSHQELANAIRFLAMDAVEQAKSGHPGMPMGMADVATVLFREFLKCDPDHPEWPDRDRFVLSAGHGSMLLYAVLHLLGYRDMTIEELRNFRQMGARTAGHPEYGHAAGIETTTGPLGQGFANAVGMALAERLLAERFGAEVMDHRTYVIAGDGCLMEGISYEAAGIAGHLKLNKLVVLFDDNGITIDGSTKLSTSEDIPARFRACGWEVQEIDGHNDAAIREALTKAQSAEKPVLIACKTKIGYGAPKKGGTAGCHGSPLGAEEIAACRQLLAWEHHPFHLPEAVTEAWRVSTNRGRQEYLNWSARLDKQPQAVQEEISRLFSGELPADAVAAAQAFKQALAGKDGSEATRKSSQNALEVLTKAIPELIGGSADLTGSNNTKTEATKPISAEDFSGRYVYYGIREHAMAAAMNGMALHGGIIPYSGTFLVFTDYCRPSIRLSALMGVRVIYVMTHDSIGLGEDGPTHQPVEHLASLRAIPNLQVFRPADAMETMECWELAVASPKTPSVLALSRQNLPFVRKQYTAENKCALGAYVLSPAEGKEEVTLLATGSEVEIALKAQSQLKEAGIGATVVSVPCVELFEQQPESYRKQVLPTSALKVAIEAGIRQSWDKFLGFDGIFVGMSSFGASAPAEELYRHFNITAQNVTAQVKARLGK
jgi:transketolase